MSVVSLSRGNFDGGKLTILRELNLMTLNDVGEKIGKSAAFISQLENKKSEPSFDTILKLAKLFKVNHTFFLNNDNIKVSVSPVFYRKQVAVSKKKWIQAERTNVIFAFLENKISTLIGLKYFEKPKYVLKDKNFKQIDFEDIDHVANRIREDFNLGNGPINNMTLLAEKMGIRVHFSDFYSAQIDALTEKIDGKYYISLNSSRTSSVRIRYNLAHEIGHIFLHSGYSEKDVNNSSNHKRIEAEAQHFAGVLLMPTEGLALDMARNNMEFLKELKKHWRVSIQALIYRGTEIGLITQQQALFLRQTIARKGWRKEEPYDDKIKIERPSLLESALMYSKIDMRQLVKNISEESGISESDILNILGFEEFSNVQSSKKFKVIQGNG